MKVVKIEPYIVSQNLKQPFFFSQWEYCTRTICIVKVTGEDGSYGWGEGYGPAHLIKAGIEFFEPYVLNMDVIQNETIWQKMYLRSLDYARRGVFMASLSAIDVALWDLKGKILGYPVSVLLGGRKREYVRPYATGLYFTRGGNLPQKFAEEAMRYKEEGFQAIKMKVGLGLKRDIENIAMVRKSIGYNIDLMIDANHAFNLNEAIRFSDAAKEFQISWFEEPISPENYDGYAELREKSSIPIAGGECEYLQYGFLQLFQKRCIDIAQPDICAAGGLTEVKKIINMAHTFGVEVVPHTWGTGIALNAALHLISNMDVEPGRMYEPELMLEFDRTENPLRDLLVEPCSLCKGGKMAIPDAPGLGIDINPEYLEKFGLK